MRRLFGIEIEDLSDKPYAAFRYKPAPPLIYGKGYSPKYSARTWVFFPFPLCYIMRLLARFVDLY